MNCRRDSSGASDASDGASSCCPSESPRPDCLVYRRQLCPRTHALPSCRARVLRRRRRWSPTGLVRLQPLAARWGRSWARWDRWIVAGIGVLAEVRRGCREAVVGGVGRMPCFVDTLGFERRRHSLLEFLACHSILNFPAGCLHHMRRTVGLEYPSGSHRAEGDRSCSFWQVGQILGPGSRRPAMDNMAAESSLEVEAEAVAVGRSPEGDMDCSPEVGCIGGHRRNRRVPTL